MQTINHVATALLLKKKFPETPLFGLILTTEAVEYLWVGLNNTGIEKTTIGADFLSVADVHLEHMPFSHSIITSFILAALLGLFFFWRSRKAALAIATAVSLGVLSHVFLDLLVHAPDIAVVPFTDIPKLGTGLYAEQPLMALMLETAWGIFCWWVFRGSLGLLALIVILEVTAIPLYSTFVNIGETALSGHSLTFALIVLVQMLATSGLVWLLAHEKAEPNHIKNAT